MFYKLKILEIKEIARDIFEIRLEKPENYEYFSGQHVIISIPEETNSNLKRLYTIASSPHENFLKFIIKSYKDREGLSKKIASLKSGDFLEVSNAKGKLKYSGEGIFIAAGTGVVPFYSIAKSLHKERSEDKNVLLFSVKSCDELFLENELRNFFSGGCHITLTRENKDGYFYGRIDEEMIKKFASLNKKFYVCGPINFIKDIKGILKKSGIDESKILSELG